MTKIKCVLISAAILIAVGGALATRPQNCLQATQYYKIGSTYFSAGVYGIDYTCLNAAGTCTFYKPNPAMPNWYVPCRTGAFSYVY